MSHDRDGSPEETERRRVLERSAGFLRSVAIHLSETATRNEQLDGKVRVAIQDAVELLGARASELQIEADRTKPQR